MLLPKNPLNKYTPYFLIKYCKVNRGSKASNFTLAIIVK